MDETTVEWVLEMMYTAKHVYDAGRLDELVEIMEDIAGGGKEFIFDPDEAFFIHEAAIGLIFDTTRSYYSEETGCTTWVFWDKAMYRYYQLCKEYEEKCGIIEIENPYFSEAEEAIARAMTFSSYDYDYQWRTDVSRERRCKLVWRMGEEFYHIYEVPEGLLELKSFFEEGVQRLETELRKERGKVISLPLQMPLQEQEAA